MRRPDELDRKLLSAIDRLGTALRVARQDVATKHGLSPLQVQIVEMLAVGEGRRIGDLADELDVSSPTVSDAVSALTAKGLVDRNPDPDDRRATLVTSNSDGRVLAERIAEDLAPVLDTTARWRVDDRGVALTLMLESIASLHRAGVITVDRSCLTCRHYASGDGEGAPARCLLLKMDLEAGDHRVRCPEHEPAA